MLSINNCQTSQSISLSAKICLPTRDKEVHMYLTCPSISKSHHLLQNGSMVQALHQQEDEAQMHVAPLRLSNNAEVLLAI